MGHPDSGSPVVQGQTSKPIVDQSWRKRHTLKTMKLSFSPRGILLKFITAIILLMGFKLLTSKFGLFTTWVWYFEIVLGIGFVGSVTWDSLAYLYVCLIGAPVEVTLQEKRLLGIRDNDPGFTLSPVRARPPSPDADHSLVFSSTPSSQGLYSTSSSPWSSSMGSHVTPTNPGGSLSGSYTYASPTAGGSFLSGNMSFDRSASFTGAGNLSQNLPYSPGVSMNSLDSSGLRSRLSLSTSFRSPSPSDKLTDLESLSMYLKDQDEKEYRASLSSPDLSIGNPSFWSYGRPSLDGSHVLRKNQYQLASRSPQSHKSRADDKDSAGEEVWRPLGVSEDDLYLWIERLRKWLGNTVMVKLVREIDNINASLRKIGCEDTEIGEVGVSTLKQLALTKGQYVPTLNVMVPYLEFADNQEYLVKRIRELGSDGCLSEFAWSSGGTRNFYGKTWGEHLPTDASALIKGLLQEPSDLGLYYLKTSPVYYKQLVMHMFCSYMDSRLPPEIKFPDGKPFTRQHFLKTPEKPNLEKDNLLLYQTSVNPPHFQVVIKNKIFNLPKGRNNLFHAILLLMFHVKTDNKGMLGRVNLGMSGVKILSVIAD